MKTEFMKPKTLLIVFSLLTIFTFLNFSRAEKQSSDGIQQTHLVVEKDSLIHLSGGFNNPYFFPDSTRDISYYLEIRADEYAPENETRIPLNLALVIDRSGSMEGEKMEYVIKAVEFIIDNISPEDYLSIVIYDDLVDVIMKPQHIDNKAWAKKQLKQVFSRGATNLSGGMLKGFDQIKNNFKAEHVNRVLLLSDGLANKGITDATSLNQIATKMSQEEGITLSTFGVGIDFNEDLMMGLAESGRANYYFIESPDQIPAIFSEELSGLLAVVAQNVELKINIPEGLRVTKVYGYDRGNNPRVIELKMHDIVSEETKSLVIEFERTQELAEYELSATLSFDDALELGVRKTLNLKSKLQKASSWDVYLQAIDTIAQIQHTLFKSNYLLSATMEAVDANNISRAREIMSENRAFLTSNFLATGANYNAEIALQDSLVLAYDSLILQHSNDDGYNGSIQMYKTTQKSVKSKNYIIRKKK